MMIEAVVTNVAILMPAITFFIGGVKSIKTQSVDANLIVGLIGMVAIFLYDYFHPGIIQTMLGVNQATAADTSNGIAILTVVLVILFLLFLQRSPRF